MYKTRIAGLVLGLSVSNLASALSLSYEWHISEFEYSSPGSATLDNSAAFVATGRWNVDVDYANIAPVGVSCSGNGCADLPPFADFGTHHAGGSDAGSLAQVGRAATWMLTLGVELDALDFGPPGPSHLEWSKTYLKDTAELSSVLLVDGSRSFSSNEKPRALLLLSWSRSILATPYAQGVATLPSDFYQQPSEQDFAASFGNAGQSFVYQEDISVAQLVGDHYVLSEARFSGFARAVSAIPEPACWNLTLIGLGMLWPILLGLRRRSGAA